MSLKSFKDTFATLSFGYRVGGQCFLAVSTTEDNTPRASAPSHKQDRRIHIFEPQSLRAYP